MKNNFTHFYPTLEKDIKIIWADCVFVFDTNVLLDLYRYTSKTRKELYDIFDRIKHRIWIPHQVALEFLKNRPDVIITQENMFEKANKILNDIIENADKDINKNLNFRHHPAIDKNLLFNKVKKGIGLIIKDLKSKQKKHKNLMEKDDILDKVSQIFYNKVGQAYSEEKLEEIYKIGVKRYKDKIPPGYRDSIGDNKKEGNDIYGDLLIWFQIIDYAKNVKKNIIFISNDYKEDWWWIKKGKTIGCRPELKGELMKKAGVTFHMYSSDRFLNYARINLDLKIDSKSIDEVKDIRIKQKEAEDRNRFDSDTRITENLIFNNMIDKLKFSNKEKLFSSDELINEINKFKHKLIYDDVINEGISSKDLMELAKKIKEEQKSIKDTLSNLKISNRIKNDKSETEDKDDDNTIDEN
ncbi:MAG: DUF4935 domain-containing protein [Ignavibacterium sp.]|nr:DUF4935 domain-containing protein [Ignavibacterium sp.]